MKAIAQLQVLGIQWSSDSDEVITFHRLVERCLDVLWSFSSLRLPEQENDRAVFDNAARWIETLIETLAELLAFPNSPLEIAPPGTTDTLAIAGEIIHAYGNNLRTASPSVVSPDDVWTIRGLKRRALLEDLSERIAQYDPASLRVLGASSAHERVLDLFKKLAIDAARPIRFAINLGYVQPGVLREVPAEWRTPELRSELSYLRRLLGQEHDCAMATPVPAVTNPRSRMSKGEANTQAREILRANPNITARELSQKIGCALGSVSNLPAWKAVQERKAAQKSRKPREVSLTSKLEACSAEDGGLQPLIDEQNADSEPSPLEDDPPPRDEGHPRKVRVYRPRR